MPSRYWEMSTRYVACTAVKGKKALVDSGLLYKDFSTAQDILEMRKNLLRCTTGSAKLDSFLGRMFKNIRMQHRNGKGG